MTMLVTGATSDVDQSGSAQTAAGPVQFSFSGTLGSGKKKNVRLTIMARTDTVAYRPAYETTKFEPFKINFASGTDYYPIITGIESTDSIDLSAVDV